MGSREWQSKALDYVKQNNHCIIQAATGTGKTYLSINILKYIYSLNPHFKTLIVAPKNVILEKTWFKALTKNFPLTQVGLFYGDIKETSLITVTNIQSIDKLNVDDYDVFIADELHNMYSDRLIAYLKKPMSYKIGLTATMKRRDYKHWEVLEIFGFNVFNYTLEQGVRDKVLSDYHFHNVPIYLTEPEQEQYEELDNKISQIQFAAKNPKKTLWDITPEQRYAIYDQRKKILCNSPEKIDILDKLKPLVYGKKIIVFNEYNSISHPIFWKLTELGFKPCIFNSSISKNVRMRNLDNYANGKYDIIITTRALDEGYDLPEIDVAIILSGGNASRQMIQRAGRVLRKTLNDKDIYQVYFSETIEEETALKRYELIKDSCKSYEVLEL